MSFVQGNRNTSLAATGGTGPSLAGVVAGHGLFYWQFVDATVTGSPTISDSSGTTWALVTNLALSTDNESLLVFKTTGAVGAGTHTITPTYAGGGSFFGWLVEDTGSYDGSAVGQRLSGPGAGNTLKPGGNVGASGDTVYMLAVDALNTGATFVPGLNGFTSIDSGNNASIGTWRLGWSTTVGGTNPAMATGSGDTGGTDEYGVFAIAFSSSSPAPSFRPPRAPLRGPGRLSFLRFPPRYQWDYSGGSVTVALTGQAATFSAGTLSPATSVALTGQAAAFAAGTLTPALSVALAGQAATFATGTLLPATSVAVTGQAAAFTAGTLSAAIDTALTGISANFAAGTLVPTPQLGLTGISGMFSPGALSVSIDTALLGQQALFAPGQLGVQGDVTVALTGASATFSAGQLGIQGAATQDAGGRVRPAIYFVEVEGKRFEAPTLADALNILAKVKSLAKKHALNVARAATSRAKPNKPVPPIRIPKIKGSEVLREAAAETQKEVRAIYESALRDAEIGMLIEIAKRRDEEEDTILLLM